MTRDEWIALGAAALKAEDKYRRENNMRCYSVDNLRYEVAARVVYDAFVEESLRTRAAM